MGPPKEVTPSFRNARNTSATEPGFDRAASPVFAPTASMRSDTVVLLRWKHVADDRLVFLVEDFVEQFPHFAFRERQGSSPQRGRTIQPTISLTLPFPRRLEIPLALQGM